MTEMRRYREEEIRQIFEMAASDRDLPERSASPDNALTLSELQEIGSQVGIEPDRIAQAAWSMGSPPLEVRRWPFGIPIAVRRTVDLPRAPTQHEWDVLVTELRDTFDAPGHVTGGGGIYEWRNGSLHAYIEPAMGGYRLRMNTRKGSAVAMSMAGLVGIGWSALAFIGLSLTGDLDQGFLAPTLVSLVSGAGLASALLRLPGWARERGEQMEQIAHRARALISPGAEERTG
jgi:hypothetical protein